MCPCRGWQDRLWGRCAAPQSHEGGHRALGGGTGQSRGSTRFTAGFGHSPGLFVTWAGATTLPPPGEVLELGVLRVSSLVEVPALGMLLGLSQHWCSLLGLQALKGFLCSSPHPGEPQGTPKGQVE